MPNIQKKTTVSSEVAEALLQSSPKALAINTFLASPTENLLIPYAKLLKLCTLLSSSFSTV